jgi:sec-independent protein translocase protein TatA
MSEKGKAELMVGLFESLGVPEILLILAVVLLLFGAKKLPEMARSLGKSSHEFKKGMREGQADEAEDRERAQAPSDTATTSEKKTE